MTTHTKRLLIAFIEAAYGKDASTIMDIEVARDSFRALKQRLCFLDQCELALGSLVKEKCSCYGDVRCPPCVARGVFAGDLLYF